MSAQITINCDSACYSLGTSPLQQVQQRVVFDASTKWRAQRKARVRADGGYFVHML